MREDVDITLGEQQYPIKSGSILVVDDDTSIQNALRRHFKNHFPDITFKTANNGLEGLGIVQSSGADLIITDVMMPGMDGPAMVKELRETVQNTTPIIMMSGSSVGASKDPQTLLDQGYIEAFLEKPFTMQQLIAHVRPYITSLI